MAQAGFTPIQLYFSTTAAAVPLAANLAQGELAINITDGKLYYENNSGTVTLLASAAGASGDVVGPASATDNAVARFDGTTGKLIQNGVVIIGDTGAVTGVTDLTTTGNTILGDASTDTLNVGNGGLIKDASGNLGLGVTPSAWSLIKGLQVTGGGFFGSYLNNSYMGANWYFDGTNKYIASDYATRYEQNDGQHIWYTAPSGTAGNAITFTQAMTLDADGDLGIGTTTPSTRLEVAQNSSGVFSPSVAISGTSAGAVLRLAFDSQGARSNIVGGRDSATVGSTASYMAFETRQSGGGMTEGMRLDSSGNLGLGVTPSAWNSSWKAFQFAANSALASQGSVTDLQNNAYRNTSNVDTYIGADFATRYRQITGTHTWATAPSGTAGNAITFTQAMTLDASGRLGIGTTSPTTDLSITNSSGPIIRMVRTSNRFEVSADTDFMSLNARDASTYITFKTADTERARIDSSGNLLVGTTSSSTGIDTGATRLFVVAPNSNFGAALTTVGDDQGRGIRFTDQSKTVTGALDAGSSKITFGSNSAHPLTFITSGVERARIDTSGVFLVGKTASGVEFSAKGTQLDQDGGTYFCRDALPAIHVSRLTSDGAVVNFHRATSSPVGTISVTATATAYNTSSDYRLKNTIAPMTGALAKVALLKPCIYKWNADGSDGEGFIAHELAEVVPQCVSGEKDAVDADGKPQYQGIDTSFLVATLTAAIQEQQAIIESLKARLDAANL